MARCHHFVVETTEKDITQLFSCQEKPDKKSPLLSDDFFDFDFGEWLAVADIAAIADFRLIFNHRDFFGSALFHDCGLNFTDIWLANFEFSTLVISDEHGFEFKFVANFFFELLNLELFTLADKILLAAGFNNCEHNYFALTASCVKTRRASDLIRLRHILKGLRTDVVYYRRITPPKPKGRRGVSTRLHLIKWLYLKGLAGKCQLLIV